MSCARILRARARDEFYCVFATTTILTLCSANTLDKPVLVLACVSNVIVCSVIVKKLWLSFGRRDGWHCLRRWVVVGMVMWMRAVKDVCLLDSGVVGVGSLALILRPTTIASTRVRRQRCRVIACTSPHVILGACVFGFEFSKLCKELATCSLIPYEQCLLVLECCEHWWQMTSF